MKFSRFFLRIALVFTLILFINSCEKEISLKLKEGEQQLVVEGHIEPGFPPYVILTRTQPYFSPVSVSELTNIFVHEARISVSNGLDTFPLKEYSSDMIPSALLKIISAQTGFQLADREDTAGLKVFVYTTFDNKIFGKTGDTYTLRVDAESKVLSSETTILEKPLLDSAWATPHPTNDTLFTLNIRYSDPPGVRNYIRYFTSTNSHPFFPPYFQSVFDDLSIFNVDGKTFDIPIQQGHNRTKGINFDTFTYFTEGDSVVVRWCAIEKQHFEFWNTAEFDRASTGNPFSSPVRISSNITGGLGIWGSYSPTYYSLRIGKN